MGQFARSFAAGHEPAEELDEPLLYHDTARPGFTSLVTPGWPRRQVSFKLHELPQQLATMRARGVDSYIAQNEFFRPNRRVVSCWRLTSHYIDLDTYKVPETQGLSAEHLVGRLLIACEDAGIPEPSVVVYSGRGLQAKWLLSTPVPSAALPRWQAVQDELCARLAHLGADERALDASRVLRLVGTTNSRSGHLVRVVHRASVPTMGAMLRCDGVTAHDFEVFAETILPVSRSALRDQTAERAELETQEASRREADDLRKQAARREKLVVIPGGADKPAKRWGGRPLVPSQLAWDRLSDLRRLTELRGWRDGAPPGQRDTLVFLAATFLANAKLVRDFRLEVRELARQFAPTWSEAEVSSCVSSVLGRAEAAQRGERVDFHGFEVDPRYRFSNRRLVELLKLSAVEQEAMTTIVGKPEACRRDRERQARNRLAKGCLTRDEFLGQAAAVARQARELRALGHSLSEIARTLDVSRTSASRYCSE